jgi:hypothetical protein
MLMVGVVRGGRGKGMEGVAMGREFMVMFLEESGRIGIRESLHLSLHDESVSLMHHSWNATSRLGVISDLYGGVGACSMFRMAQGWLSMSNIKGGEGHLLVNPVLKGAMAYLLLRPFFQEKKPSTSLSTEAYLSPSNWILEPETSVSPLPLHPRYFL